MTSLKILTSLINFTAFIIVSCTLNLEFHTIVMHIKPFNVCGVCSDLAFVIFLCVLCVFFFFFSHLYVQFVYKIYITAIQIVEGEKLTHKIKSATISYSLYILAYCHIQNLPVDVYTALATTSHHQPSTAI